MLGRVINVPQHPDLQHLARVKKKYWNTELLGELFTDACIQVVRVIYETAALLQFVSQIWRRSKNWRWKSCNFVCVLKKDSNNLQIWRRSEIGGLDTCAVCCGSTIYSRHLLPRMMMHHHVMIYLILMMIHCHLMMIHHYDYVSSYDQIDWSSSYDKKSPWMLAPRNILIKDTALIFLWSSP